jgi:hypothetical protein
MTRTVSAFVTAGLLVCGTTLLGQSTATTTTTDKKWDSKEITVSGCVEKTKSGGYFLVPSEHSRSSRDTEGTSGTATTTATDSARSHERGTWNLGQAGKLERYVGQRVEVIGRPEHDTSGDQLKGTHGGREVKARDIDVKSIAVLAPTCR